MVEPSRLGLAVAVALIFVLFWQLVFYLSDGAGIALVTAATAMCVGVFFIGPAWIRRRACAVLSRTSYSNKGRFSKGFAHFRLSDLDVVSRQPLVVKMAAENGSEADRRRVPLPTVWMNPRQAADFRDEFVDRWQACRDENNTASASASETCPP